MHKKKPPGVFRSPVLVSRGLLLLLSATEHVEAILPVVAPWGSMITSHMSVRIAAGFLVTTLSMSTVVADAQGSSAPTELTERDVVAAALARPSLREILEGRVAIEEGRGRVNSAHPNPELSYTREQTFGALGTGEDYLTLSQSIDLGNRRRLRRAAGQVRMQASIAEGEARRLEVAITARRQFYEVLYSELRVETLEGWVTRIDEALAIVTAREDRGEAAAYDRMRLQRERALAVGRREVERAAYERAASRLLVLLGSETQRLHVTTTLLPETEPAALPALREILSRRPDLRTLDLQRAAAQQEQASASRWWVPELVLQAGWKGIDAGSAGRADGFVAGASLSLPLWNTSSGLARSAEGEAQVARGERALLEGELEGALAGVRAEAVVLREAATELREQIRSSRELLRIAAAGYAGGELGLLELLDAYRGSAEDDLALLEMEYNARRAYIEIDRLTGVEFP